MKKSKILTLSLLALLSAAPALGQTAYNGKVSVSEASCPSQDCVRHLPSDSGAPIVCLPNRMVIKFADEAGYDALIG